MPVMMWTAETHENAGFGQTVFSIYHMTLACHAPHGSFFVLIQKDRIPYGFLGRGSGGNRSLASKERFPPENFSSSILQPFPVVHEGGGAGLVDVVVASVPVQKQVAAGQLHLHGAVAEARQHSGDQRRACAGAAS